MSVGIKDIAKACNLSNITVSDILNRGRGHLYRPETAERVVRAATELNYHPNRSARSMRSQRTNVVGFLANNTSAEGTLDNYTVYPFVIGMSHYFTDLGYHVSLVEMKELQGGQPDEVPEVLREDFLDGIVVHYGVPEPIQAMLARRSIPVVWWDAGVFEEFDCIYRDDGELARRLTRHLIGLGHRRIAIMVGQTGWQKYQAGLPMHYSYGHRYEGYLAVMEEHGLEALRIVGYDVDKIVEQLDGPGVTAVVAMGQQALHHLVAPCIRLGWSIPDGLTVAACDTEWRIRARNTEQGGMGYDRYDAGQRAADMLRRKIDTPGYRAPTERIEGILIDGNTIGPPRGTF